MSTPADELTIPPVHVVVSDVITQLAIVAHASLEPRSEGATLDLKSAELAIDVAGFASHRARMLTELRMTFVRMQEVHG